MYSLYRINYSHDDLIHYLSTVNDSLKINNSLHDGFANNVSFNKSIVEISSYSHPEISLVPFHCLRMIMTLRVNTFLG